MLNSILYSKPKVNLYIFILLILFSFLPLLKNTYSSYKAVGLLKCEENTCTIELSMSYKELNILDQNPQISYLNKKYKINDITRGEPYLNNNIPFVDVILTTDYISDSNVIEFNLIYNKQRIGKKIIDIMKE